MRDIFTTLDEFGAILAFKLYRLSLDAPVEVPTLPCLDHEASLHQTIAPHVAMYLQERQDGGLHELAVTPSRQRIDVDTVSTIDEHSQESHERLLRFLRQKFPAYTVAVHRPSRWQGDYRVADACRAQVTLREVLLGQDFERLNRRINRLQIVSSLMEKHSRVASWGVRTVTAPVLAAVGVIVFQVLGYVTPRLGEGPVTQLRYAIVGLIGVLFLYYGLKAVQLTGMANRVWKRSAEYSLILAGRERLKTPGRT